MLLIEINGEDSGDWTGGLVASGTGVTIRGLVINRFGINVVPGRRRPPPGRLLHRHGPDRHGLAQPSGGRGRGSVGLHDRRRAAIAAQRHIGQQRHRDSRRQPDVIQGNFIGIDATGTAALPNDINVHLDFFGATVIGGPAECHGSAAGQRHLGQPVVRHLGVPGLGNYTMTIQGNLIGTNATGTAAIPNKFHGIRIVKDTPGPGNTLVGGVDPEDGNVIAYNLGDGISTAPEGPESFVNIASRSNRIHSNTGLGIDLYGNGVTPNIAGGGRNYPVLTAAVSSGGSTTIQGTLNSVPGEAGIEIEFFSNAECDPSGYGEGAMPIGSTTVRPTAAATPASRSCFRSSSTPAPS